jgi:hypothetical protein
MQGLNNGRRATLAALSVWALACALPAAAQDPALGEARSAALEWLTVVDVDNATATHAAASAKFRSTMTQAQWSEALTQARAQFGAMERRTFAGAQKADDPAAKAQGEFAVLVFRSNFAKRDTVVETLTMERESDGKWRVAGYSLR